VLVVVTMNRNVVACTLVFAFVTCYSNLCTAVEATSTVGPTFLVSFPKSLSNLPLDGRVLVLISNGDTREPRFQFGETSFLFNSQLIYGVNAETLSGDKQIRVDSAAFGWPIRSLADVKAGDYDVQAVLNRYETFHLADGRVLKLAPDRGEGKQWNLAPGNLYSKPIRVHLDPRMTEPVNLVLDQEIPPIPPQRDTEYIRSIRIKSERLSRFWGRPMYLTAHVLVPKGFDRHPNSRFPLLLSTGHFRDAEAIDNFRTTPPDPNVRPDPANWNLSIDIGRTSYPNYELVAQEEGYEFYKKWTSENFPRFLIVEVDHANPYYDNSYGVNSANLGPYDDAINLELLPEVEKRFHAIGQSWARFVYGVSAGGWIAMETQLFHPDEYNGVFAACPAPLDFTGFFAINIYADPNAYVIQGRNHQVERPGWRNFMGNVFATQRDLNYYELALGDHVRSGAFRDAFDAFFGPVGLDGYPKPLFDKLTGEIDRSVAMYWRDHFDLSYYLKTHWSEIGEKLKGKLHIYVGTSDSVYVDSGVYQAEKVLKSLLNPTADADVEYSDKPLQSEHCFVGQDQDVPNYRADYQVPLPYLPKILERIRATAPPGADLKSWRY
jgi:pimeloyl-ACP methyl ester carboxylesterase